MVSFYTQVNLKVKGFTLSRDKESFPENVLELILGQRRVSLKSKQMFIYIDPFFSSPNGSKLFFSPR